MPKLDEVTPEQLEALLKTPGGASTDQHVVAILKNPYVQAAAKLILRAELRSLKVRP